MRLSADIFFDMPKGANVRLFGLKIPELWSFTVRWDLESGKRYRELVDVENNIYAKDPKFKDPDKNDYNLKKSSPGRNVGIEGGNMGAK